MDAIREVFVEHDCEDQFDGDEMVTRLKELRDSLRKEYDVGPTLQERLAEAVALEQYELAARLRDELAQQQPRAASFCRTLKIWHATGDRVSDRSGE